MPHDRAQIVAELELGIRYLQYRCPPPRDFAYEILWHEHELGEYADICLVWEDEYRATPWHLIESAQLALQVFDEAMEWSAIWEVDEDEEDEDGGEGRDELVETGHSDGLDGGSSAGFCESRQGFSAIHSISSSVNPSGFHEAPLPTDVLFLTVFHNLPGTSDGYRIDYYQPADRGRLRLELACTVNHYLSLFSESYDYEDYFSCAEYGIDDDAFDEVETDIFRSALAPGERKRLLTGLHPRAIFRGCCAVIGARLHSADLALNRSGIQLFNLIMEGALPTDDNRNPRCYIQLQTAKEFAPGFIDRLLDAISALGNSLRDHREHYLGEAFRPLQPLMEILTRAVHRQSWPQSDLDIGRFLLLVDHYQQVMGSFEGYG